MTTWHSDTCGCIIDFDDDQILPNGRFKVRKVIQQCPDHSTPDISGHDDLYDTSLGDNQRKNVLLGKMLEAHPELADINEAGGKVLKKDIDYIHSYTGKGKNRVLEVEFAGPNFVFAKKHKDKIKEISDTEFGAGKVVVK